MLRGWPSAKPTPRPRPKPKIKLPPLLLLPRQSGACMPAVEKDSATHQRGSPSSCPRGGSKSCDSGRISKGAVSYKHFQVLSVSLDRVWQLNIAVCRIWAELAPKLSQQQYSDCQLQRDERGIVATSAPFPFGWVGQAVQRQIGKRISVQVMELSNHNNRYGREQRHAPGTAYA